MKHLMPKSLICLSAVLLVLLCACQQTQPDNVIFPSPDQPSPVPTVQVSAMPDQPSPSPTAQDSAAPEQSGPAERQAAALTTAQEDELYDMVLNSIVYMFTNGGQDVGPHGASGAGYRFDVDGDGTQDWVVGNSDLYWLICAGGREGFYGYAFPNGNASVTVYGSDKDELVIQQGNGTASALWKTTSVFRGTTLEEALSTTTHFLNEETYTFYDAGTEPVDYMVDGKPASKSEYDSAATALGKLTRLGLTSFQFVRSTTLGPSQLQSAAALLEVLPFCSEMLTADVNGDGVEDCGLFLTKSGDQGAEDISITYGAGEKAWHGWKDCCLILLSSDYCVGAKILSRAEALKLFHSAAANETDTPGLADGEYTVEIYGDSFQEVADGLRAYANVIQPITFSEQYVRSLKLGDVIDLSPYGYSNITIQTMSFDSSQGPEVLSFGENEFRLVKYDSSSEWVVLYSAGYAEVTYTTEKVPLLFASDVEILSERDGIGNLKRLDNIQSLFESLYQPIDIVTVTITIQGGKVTKLFERFSPA